jgi:hypothetical protein
MEQGRFFNPLLKENIDSFNTPRHVQRSRPTRLRVSFALTTRQGGFAGSSRLLKTDHHAAPDLRVDAEISCVQKEGGSYIGRIGVTQS